MKKFMFAWILLIIGLLGSLYFIGSTVKKETEKYTSYEGDIKEAASMYLDTKGIKMKLYEKQNIPIKELIKSNLLSNIDIKNEKCDGYVTIEKNLKQYTYTPYIKCKKYKTHGYKE